MGHATDTEVVYTDATYESAFADWATERSREEGIHASIGTLANLLSRHVYPASVAEKMVGDYAEKRLDSYGPGICVAVYREQDIARRTVTVRGTIDGDAWGGGYNGREEALNALVASKLTLKDGEYIEGSRLATRPETYTNWLGQEDVRNVQDVMVHSKVIVTVPKEKTETRYFVHAVTNSSLTLASVKWDTGYATQAKARAAMIERLEASTGDAHEALTVTALTRRESGAGLVTAERRITKAQVAVQVTVSKVKAGAKAGGWAMAHSFHK